jgi:diaminopimelate epimerase
MEVAFAKFHGLGNDFIVSRGRGLPRNLPAFARAILSRHTGVGGDGFIAVLPPRSKKHDARVRFFNADGSEAEMSGNGIRCVGAFLVSSGRSKRTLEIETAAGVKFLQAMGKEKKGNWTFRVGMGSPILEPSRIPFKSAGPSAPIVGLPLTTRHAAVSITVTSMGNPHCTIFVPDFAALDWRALGRDIETHELFPHRTNVEFVRPVSRKEIEVRFWERGVGHTLSSGTGSCAATVASILNGLTDRQVRVHTEAGILEVAWPERGEVSLTGAVECVGRGLYYYQPQ